MNISFEALGWIILKDYEIDRICYDSRKQTEQEVKLLKWCDKWLGEKHNYMILSEKQIEKGIY